MVNLTRRQALKSTAAVLVLPMLPDAATAQVVPDFMSKDRYRLVPTIRKCKQHMLVSVALVFDPIDNNCQLSIPID